MAGGVTLPGPGLSPTSLPTGPHGLPSNPPNSLEEARSSRSSLSSCPFPENDYLRVCVVTPGKDLEPHSRKGLCTELWRASYSGEGALRGKDSWGRGQEGLDHSSRRAENRGVSLEKDAGRRFDSRDRSWLTRGRDMASAKVSLFHPFSPYMLLENLSTLDAKSQLPNCLHDSYQLGVS